MANLRGLINELKLSYPYAPDCMAHQIAVRMEAVLNGSRETTEKMTHISYQGEETHDRNINRILVTNHKARIVLDG